MIRVSLDQPFAEYSTAQRAVILAWCATHDWGGAQATWLPSGGGLVVSSACYSEAAGWDIEVEMVTTFRELRNWAGY